LGVTVDQVFDQQRNITNTFAQCRQLSVNSITLPLHAYDRTVGTTTIDGTFYTGLLYPAYQGNYFFADYTSKWIKRMVFDANDNVVNVLPFAANVSGPVDLEMGPDGTIYYVAFSSGEIGRIRWGTGSQPPVAKAAAIPTSGYSALTVNFSSAGSADPEGSALTYFWDFGDNGTSTEFDPTYTYKIEGKYDITLIATNDHGDGAVCSDTLVHTVIAKQGGLTKVPNAFTPNQNGPSGGIPSNGSFNDVFLPIMRGVTQFEMLIFNRWGQLLFESRDQSTGWDGYYQGKLCEQDVYMYKLTVRLENGQDVVRTGDVNLIR